MARLPFTARIERPPLYRGGSASKKNGLPAPSPHSEAARCASTEDHQAPSPPLFCEQEGHLAALYPLHYFIFKGSLVDPRLRASNEHILIVRVPRAGGRPGYPSHPSEAARCASTEDHQAPSLLCSASWRCKRFDSHSCLAYGLCSRYT